MTEPRFKEGDLCVYNPYGNGDASDDVVCVIYYPNVQEKNYCVYTVDDCKTAESEQLRPLETTDIPNLLSAMLMTLGEHIKAAKDAGRSRARACARADNAPPKVPRGYNYRW
jgi:hypothetical protein